MLISGRVWLLRCVIQHTDASSKQQMMAQNALFSTTRISSTV